MANFPISARPEQSPPSFPMAARAARKAALYLAYDYAKLVDVEVERLKEALKEVSHEN